MDTFSAPGIIFLGLAGGAIGFGAFKWRRGPERRARRLVGEVPTHPLDARGPWQVLAQALRFNAK